MPLQRLCKIVLVVDENTEKKLADKVPRMRLTLVMVMELLPATAMRRHPEETGSPVLAGPLEAVI